MKRRKHDEKVRDERKQRIDRDPVSGAEDTRYFDLECQRIADLAELEKDCYPDEPNEPDR